jgi:hypothetical protein
MKINATEQQDIEWKRAWKDEYLEWICGFANARVGSDKNGYWEVVKTLDEEQHAEGDVV